MTASDTICVRDILLGFADRTGLTNPAVLPARYLWTDAHAVCTFFGLYSSSGESRYRDLALALIDQVHAVLGRHRSDDIRSGWISGLDEEQGRLHPTAGGLRIGKPLKERRRSAPLDERLEWDRDGQYFHYLTKWMHALSRAAELTGNPCYRRWARELAKAAFAAFAVATPHGTGLYWKMSIDLRYPLVASFGHHDPLDGYVTFTEVADGGDLEPEISALAAMVEAGHWVTTDPLGIGGLLFDCNRVIRLTAAGRMAGSELAAQLVTAARDSLAAYVREARLDLAAEYRLAFRELGLSIGLRAVDGLPEVAANADPVMADVVRKLDDLRRYVPLADRIESFWRTPANQEAGSWRAHLDINAVSLATSLMPMEFLAV